jgi:hypothetical protein
LICNLKGVYSDKEILAAITECFMRDKTSWVNLVIIKNKLIENQSSFDVELHNIKRLRALMSNSKGDEAAREEISKLRSDLNKIRLVVTPAGYRFLRHIIIHFEYFSVLADNDSPLFLLGNDGLVMDHDRYDFEVTIERALNIVERYSRLINRYYEKEYVPRLNWTPEQFKRSYFCFKFYGEEDAAKDTGLFYTTRVISSHIAYIDKYRRYIISKYKRESEDAQLQEINMRLAKLLNRYVCLLKGMTDPEGKVMANVFGEKLAIIEAKEFRDYSTTLAIDRFQ